MIWQLMEQYLVCMTIAIVKYWRGVKIVRNCRKFSNFNCLCRSTLTHIPLVMKLKFTSSVYAYCFSGYELRRLTLCNDTHNVRILITDLHV